MDEILLEENKELTKSIGLTRIKFNIKFGKVLVDSGIVSDEEMDRALETQEMGRKKGQNPLIGDIIARQCNIQRNDIEKIFAQHLFRNILRHFKYVLLHDPVLLSYFDARSDFLEKLSVKIPLWELDGVEKNVIRGKAIFLVKTKNGEEITVNIPLEYFIEDQVTTIDFLGSIEYLKSQIIDSNGGVSDIELEDMGIQISELKSC